MRKLMPVLVKLFFVTKLSLVKRREYIREDRIITSGRE